ncbi:MAG: sensor histidine kinase [Bacteroidales bacterium]
MNFYKKIEFEYIITAVYLILGCMWILFSDMLLEIIVDDKDKVIHIQTYKGWFYVLITGIFFFVFIKRHLVKLREAQKRATESDKLKSAFLENVSHEIRTPMNGILGFAELLKTPGLTGEQQGQYIKIIEKSSERMLLLINDLVAISRLETGEIRVNKADINVLSLMDHLFYIFEQQALDKGVKLFRKECPGLENPVIYSDEEKLTAILSHLIKNAVKFTEKGSIEYGCLKVEETIEFYVRDTGIGIPPERIDHIFDRFVKAENVVKMGYQGAGLGLSISKAYAAILGGKIWAEPNLPEGSCFRFSVPIN